MNDLDFLGDAFSDFKDFIEEKPVSNQEIPMIYLVEDDKLLSQSILIYLSKKLGLKVKSFEGPNDFLAHLAGLDEVDQFCLLTDISFENSGTDGLYLIDVLRDKGYKFASIVMTGFASIETAIAATKKGVFHYLTKPFELEILSNLVVRAMTSKLNVDSSLFNNKVEEAKETTAKKVKLVEPTEDDFFCGMIGRSKAMKKIFERIKKVANSNSTVLIGGPSGTGKELVAKAIHELSPRASKNVINVNCGAIPSELLESELFGHEKGAFTGAISTRMGRFEVASGGTIFLDEIGDMPLLLQVKLLRVLQNREIERVGSTSPIPVDVRIVTATHRDLEKSVTDGNFREDLYYRLNVIPIKIPALKDRKEDIPILISYFLSRFVSADGRNAISFDDEVLEVLLGYDWPGNVRELENLIERLVILRGGNTIRIEDLPPKIIALSNRRVVSEEDVFSLPEEGIDLKTFLNEVEESLIKQALTKTSGNKNQASKLLSMNRTTLIEKMKKRNMLEL
ncbi:sigma-54 dependent transcriptional regulator [Bacteriovorax sp. Seq25_V]|uniref:sigma-54-dependent transcriptional regulator n=1 Tax=Bacteriovorax sp. Seq25_V TaxID=1201288 RepID=UPI000389FF2A|nr:sigma-54 dependent transcriptional regulator [Bacteriovorax sp. Seq25_V]EQC44799.1 putative transcriptional regulatory protein ZraR [Bacteriovorax sp. Seq25_V]